MSLVVISREMGSGGTQLGRAIAERLGYRFGDREVILEAVRRYRVPEENLSRLEESKPSFFERLDRERYLAYLRAVMYAFAADDDVVITGRAAPFFFAGVDNALRIRVTAPAAIRAARVAEESKIPLDEAQARIARYDRDSSARLWQIFDLDPSLPEHYDLVINSARGRIEGPIAAVTALVQNAPFRSTPEAVAALRDRAVAAQVRAELLQEPGLDTLAIEVGCEDGVVMLAGAVFTEEWEARARAVASKVSGVRRVACNSLEPAAGYIVAPPA